MRATAAIADAQGLDAVTVTNVAKALDIKPPSLYRHVRGREELVQLLATRAVLDATKLMASSIGGRSGSEAVRAAANAFRTYVHRHPGIWHATLPRPNAPEPTPLHLAALARMGELHDQMLRGWPNADPTLKLNTIRAIQAGLHGFVLIELVGGYVPAESATASFEAMVTALLAGLGETGS